MRDEKSLTETENNCRIAKKRKNFEQAFAILKQAPVFAKSRYQTDVFRAATDLIDLGAEGIEALYQKAGQFDEAGVFKGGAWEDPARLIPELVGPGLRDGGVISTVEALSEMRILALALGHAENERMTSQQARDFLRAACAKHLDLLFPEPTEEVRRRPAVFQRAKLVFELILTKLSIEGFRATVTEEIGFMCAQRPIQTRRIYKLITRAQQLPSSLGEREIEEKLQLYNRAIDRAGPLSQQCKDLIEYRKKLHSATTEQLEVEALAFAETLCKTGLASPYHAVLLRQFLRVAPQCIGKALGVNEAGLAAFSQNTEFCAELVKVAIFPDTANSIYGLAKVLERGLLLRSEVSGGIKRLIGLDIIPEVERMLLALHRTEAGLTANSILVAGTLSVLGQPLGVGQGNNPTCQAARGISLWSQHAPGRLLRMIIVAVRDGLVEAKFGEIDLRTNELGGFSTSANLRPDLELDPVSTVLIPHLDLLYIHMIKLASMRGEDAHKWVNPAMYGHWVSNGFISAIQALTGAIQGHLEFVRHFYATHHPEYNGGHELIYPNPVGIMVTDVHGNLLGPHAVSIQRIASSPQGELRIYFYNPNNEGRQDWGFGVKPTVLENGERHGESSLPFAEFLSRLYAFHYDPYEQGDGYAVPADEIALVSDMARKSWGKNYIWSK